MLGLSEEDNLIGVNLREDTEVERMNMLRSGGGNHNEKSNDNINHLFYSIWPLTEI